MAICCFCRLTIRKLRNVSRESVGNPPILLGELIFQCTGHRLEEISGNVGICKKCRAKLLRYYRATMVMSQLQRDFRRSMLRALEPRILNNPEKDRATCDLELEDNEEEHGIGVDEDGIVEVFMPLDETEDENLFTEEHEVNENTEPAIDNIIEELLQCPNCEDTFSEEVMLQDHLKKHHNAFICDQCGKSLTSYSGFISHSQSHNPVEAYECNICGKRYHHKVNLKHHLARHTGERPFECDICSKRFALRMGLYKHRQIHDDQTRRLKCDVCGYKFRTKSHLQRHMITHSGAKPYSCPECNICFSQLYNMKVHAREYHNLEDTDHWSDLVEC